MTIIGNKFIITNPTFTQQYSSLYYSRLHSTRFPSTLITTPITNLKQNVKTTIKGNIFKIQKMKPSILKNTSSETPTFEKLTSPDDSFVIEDDSARCGFFLKLYII